MEGVLEDLGDAGAVAGVVVEASGDAGSEKM